MTISTHTLTWSVTSFGSQWFATYAFQLTRSRGAWLVPFDRILFPSTFQLTRSRGPWHPPTLETKGYKNFNSHAHVERDCNTNRKIQCNGNFNSHAHVERDQSGIELAFAKDISTHTLTWSVTFPVRSCLLPHRHFNSHAHVERDISVRFFGQYIKNFNSHAHVERDAPQTGKCCFLTISTHTLTWSVTENLCKNISAHVISTHTLTWSVTILFPGCKLQIYDFNSHAHVERDTWCCVYLVLAQRDADLLFYLMGIGLILFTVHSHIAWHFHANLLGICGSLGVRWSKY